MPAEIFYEKSVLIYKMKKVINYTEIATRVFKDNKHLTPTEQRRLASEHMKKMIYEYGRKNT